MLFSDAQAPYLTQESEFVFNVGRNIRPCGMEKNPLRKIIKISSQPKKKKRREESASREIFILYKTIGLE